MVDKKRMWFVTLLIIIIGLVIGIFLSKQKETIQRRPALSRQKPIKLLTVKNENIQLPVEIAGHLYAYNKVELYAEVSGVLQDTPKRFKEGYRYSKGNVLIKIDDSVYKNNLLAEKSSLLNQLTLLLPDLSIDFPKQAPQWETYLKNLDLNKPLKPLPPVGSDKERYYIASRNIYNLYYKIKSMEATFAKYTLRAPFNGIVTESSINPGTLVRMGQKLGEFTSTDLYEMEAAVNVFDANLLEIGMIVMLKSEDIRGVFEGRIQRINSVVDRETMNVKVYIHLSDPRLREGMYLDGQVQGNPIPNAFIFSMDLLVRHNQVYAVEDSVLVSKRITIVSKHDGKVIVRGLADGTKILGEVWAEAKEGVALPKISSNPSPNQDKPERHSQ
jgi:multidrug efflux pump subunit AcrA (membrane-fusion protein)